MKLTKATLQKLIREEISKLTESSKIDVQYALKRIKAYNRGELTWDNMITMIIEDLGYDPSNRNIFTAVEDHFSASMDMIDDIIPMDRDIVYELYDIIERVR